MKTLTELSGSQIRMAAAAIAEARRSLPREEKIADAPVAVAEAVAEPADVAAAPAEGAEPVAPDAPIAAAEPVATDEPAAPAEAAPPPHLLRPRRSRSGPSRARR
jgi:hypothetical protein